ncbi:MAG: hypothetical protein ACE5I5_17815 [Candidatus Heimdallarchaeota archaeon]
MIRVSIDVGAKTIKAVVQQNRSIVAKGKFGAGLDEKGKVVDFTVNEKCAACAEHLVQPLHPEFLQW